MYKKLMAVFAALMIGTGCFAGGCSFDYNKEEAHNKAVELVFKVGDNALEKKLDKLLADGDITQTEYEVFLKRGKELEEKLRKLVDDLHLKYKAKKAAKEAAKKAAAEKAAKDAETKKAIEQMTKELSGKDAGAAKTVQPTVENKASGAAAATK